MCGGAQNLQIECVRMLYASETCLDVVKRDPSLKTRIRTSPSSSGVLSYGSEMVLRGFAAVFATDPGIELVQALCFLVYSALKDGKNFVCGETITCPCRLRAKIAMCVDTSVEIVNAAKSWAFA